MRTQLRRVFIVMMLAFAAAALTAGAGLAKPGDHPDHPAKTANSSNGNGQASAPGQAAPAPAAPSDEGSAPEAPTVSAAPTTYSSSSSGPRDDRGSSAATAPPSGIATQSYGYGSAALSGASGTSGNGGTTSQNRHGPGSGLRDTSHFLSSLDRRMERLATQGRTASTGTLSEIASCGYGPSTQEFLPWGDPASYYLAPQGDLASTNDWTLSHVTLATSHDARSGSAGSIVLASDNASAETPVACVNLQNPTMRFFLTHSGPRSASALDVYVVYEGLDGHQHTLTLASLTATDSWQPSMVIPIGVNMLSTASTNGWTPVSFGFAVHGLKPGESYSIDGVYVDPIWSR